MLGWELPPHNSGGLGVACLHLSESLAKYGADIDFVVPYEAEHHLKGVNVLSALHIDPLFRYGGSACEYAGGHDTFRGFFGMLDHVVDRSLVFLQKFGDLVWMLVGKRLAHLWVRTGPYLFTLAAELPVIPSRSHFLKESHTHSSKAKGT